MALLGPTLEYQGVRVTSRSRETFFEGQWSQFWSDSGQEDGKHTDLTLVCEDGGVQQVHRAGGLQYFLIPEHEIIVLTPQ